MMMMSGSQGWISLNLIAGLEVPELQLLVWSPGARQDLLACHVQGITTDMGAEYAAHLLFGFVNSLLCYQLC